MLFSLSSPQDIYSEVLAEVKNLINSFGNYSEDEEIKKAQAEAQEQLSIIQKEINTSLNQLQSNSEWDVFTLAFYGETNAGKSTLIEVLRILLNEPGKVKEREEFSKTFARYNELQKEIEACQSSIILIASEYKDKLSGIENDLIKIGDKIKLVDNQIEVAQGELKELVGILKKEKTASFIKFCKYIFGKLPEQKRLKDAKSILRGIEVGKDDDLKRQNSINQEKESLNREFNEKTKNLNAELAILQEKTESYTEKLLANADGKIIGDGRSDFTRTVTSYAFEANNQKFALLDLPGIEGNEGIVLDAINSAIQKAHAVFYVTSQPKPPQTGDKNSEGTLDKIKKHLGQQTEVYTVFNKRVKNPNSLKDMLIDSDESESLKVLDKIMSSHLGEQYRESISVSAYPAFLAAGNCWGDDYLPGKKKFLEHFNTAETLLDKSCVKTFSEQLAGDMVNNSKAKIKRSNFKKAAVLLTNVTERINKLHHEFFELQQKLIETKDLTDEKLDNASQNLKGNLDRVAHSAIEAFKMDVRKKIYDDIESDINNKEFKSALEQRSKEGVEELQTRLEASFKDQIDKFQDEVSDIAKKYLDYASELLSVYAGAEKLPEFNLNINLKGGINKNIVGLAFSLVASVAGMLLFPPAGIVAIVLTVIGAVFSIVKGIIGSLNHNYRKTQQRKKVDEVLDKSGEDIYESIKENLKKSDEPLKIGIENIKNELTKTVDHVKEINRIMEKTISGFETMSKAIVQEGGR